MSYQIRNVNNGEYQSGPNTFDTLLAQKENNILRDSIILFEPKSSSARQFTAGYTSVYPSCRSNGHSHEEYEEVYYITKGRGRIKLDNEEFSVQVGDTCHIPYGVFHTVGNPFRETFEYFWVLVNNPDFKPPSR